MATVEERIKEKRERAITKSKGFSGEPMVTLDNYKVDLSMAFNYYNVHETENNKRKWINNYLVENSLTEYLKCVDETHDYYLSRLAVLIRLLEREQYVSSEHEGYIIKTLNELKLSYEKKKLQDIKPAVKVVDITAILASKYIAEVNGELDKYITEFKPFDYKIFCSMNNIPTPVIKKISSNYESLLSELNDIDNDEQLKEAYSFLGKKELNQYIGIISSIVQEKDNLKQARKIRKPKEKKQKPASVLVKGFKFLPSYQGEGYMLHSVNPETIIGAKECWLYNTKYKVLVKYKSDIGFSAKGMTIMNITESKGRRLRKPEVFFNKSMAKNDLSKNLDELTTIEFTGNGRLGSDIIILKVF